MLRDRPSHREREPRRRCGALFRGSPVPLPCEVLLVEVSQGHSFGKESKDPRQSCFRCPGHTETLTPPRGALWGSHFQPLMGMGMEPGALGSVGVIL